MIKLRRRRMLPLSKQVRHQVEIQILVQAIVTLKPSDTNFCLLLPSSYSSFLPPPMKKNVVKIRIRIRSVLSNDPQQCINIDMAKMHFYPNERPLSKQIGITP